jgi:hypothetical protein
MFSFFELAESIKLKTHSLGEISALGCSEEAAACLLERSQK